MNRISCFILFVPILLSTVALQTVTAQKKPSGSKASAADKLVALKVTGTTRYTDREILAASGLQMGQNAAEGDFKEAVKKLGASGVFSEVVYSFISSDAGVKLELQLADTDKSKLVPAQFANFVWFTDDEVRSALQSRVPLFKQLLPCLLYTSRCV